MTDLPNSDWLTANQRYLSAELQRVLALLNKGTPELSSPAPAFLGGSKEESSREARGLFQLDQVCANFRLSPFERDILLLCAGFELDSAFLEAIARSGGAYPTFSLALASLPDAHWSALSPASSLRRWHLIEIGAGDSLTTSPLRIEERVLHFLTGITYIDRQLEGILAPVPPPDELSPSFMNCVQQAVEIWSAPQQLLPVIFLCGEHLSSQLAIAGMACKQLGASLYRLSSLDIPGSAAEREYLARLWEREAALSDSVLLIDLIGMESSQMRTASAFLETLGSPVWVASTETLPLANKAFVRLEIPQPSYAEQRQIWQAVLGPLADEIEGELDHLVAQFKLSPADIEAAVTATRTLREQDLPQSLWDACRRQARPRLDDLTQRIETAATWDDLVLPDAQHQILIDISAQVRQRTQVYETWGMAERNRRSLGISALFSGPSGTGKTLAAEVLANELHLDLYRIDLALVVSKYIGETEKNLRRVFAAAEDSGAILLFDEADALFGKRSEVKDSHDRYANIEVSYLLQRMEAYRGLAILTSNLKNALDPAFLRRIRFVVNFPFPDPAQRAEIWLRMFPAQVPCENLDWRKLSKLNIAGGNIRNIALNAAFIAADAGEPVRMGHLLRAARSEYAKLEKTLSEAEISGWI